MAAGAAATRCGVKVFYYTILGGYVAWSFVCFAYLFNTYGTPKLMTVVIANLNNVAIGVTSVLLLSWINCVMLPRELRPRWYQRAGVVACGLFYLGMALLVFMTKQLPMLREILHI